MCADPVGVHVKSANISSTLGLLPCVTCVARDHSHFPTDKEITLYKEIKMKSSGLLLGLFVACLCLTVFAAKEPKKKRGRCKCMQRFLKDVDKMIERKMQKLEEKYFLSAISDKDNSSSISKQNRRWLKLNEDVHFTKEALQTMSHNLQFVTEQVNSQNQDTESLNEHFNQLNGYVANLTGVVDRLERMMMARGGLEMTTSSTSPHESPSPEPSYPRREYTRFTIDFT